MIINIQQTYDIQK